MLIICIVLLLMNGCNEVDLQNYNAKRTVKTQLKESIQGDSYKPYAWGQVEFEDIFAGTGFEDVLGLRKTKQIPSKWSIVHKFKMRNRIGMEMVYVVRFFFSDKSCTEYVGMEYVDEEIDPVVWGLTRQ